MVLFRLLSCQVDSNEETINVVLRPSTPTPTEYPTPIVDALEPTYEPTLAPVTPIPTEYPTSIMEALDTYEPTTLAPVTDEPTTLAPVTGEPTTLAPVTGEPTTLAPVTDEPTPFPTEYPTAPVTPAPVTDEPTPTPTEYPTAPVTPAPVTDEPTPTPTEYPTPAPVETLEPTDEPAPAPVVPNNISTIQCKSMKTFSNIVGLFRCVDEDKFIVPYNCGDGSEVCCTDSNISSFESGKYGSCYEVGKPTPAQVETLDDPTPAPGTIQCKSMEAFSNVIGSMRCDDEAKFTVPYNCEDGSEICCTVSNMISFESGKYGSCYEVGKGQYQQGRS